MTKVFPALHVGQGTYSAGLTLFPVWVGAPAWPGVLVGAQPGVTWAAAAGYLEVRTRCGLAAQMIIDLTLRRTFARASDLHKHPSGPRGDRTHNPRIKSPLLCQLS